MYSKPKSESHGMHKVTLPVVRSSDSKNFDAKIVTVAHLFVVFYDFFNNQFSLHWTTLRKGKFTHSNFQNYSLMVAKRLQHALSNIDKTFFFSRQSKD